MSSAQPGEWVKAWAEEWVKVRAKERTSRTTHQVEGDFQLIALQCENLQ